MRAVALGCLLAVGCGPLPVPQQVSEAGLSAGVRLQKPCPNWCQVDGQVRALTTADGTPKVFEVTKPGAEWDSVLRETRGKWGTPDATYYVERAQGSTEAWVPLADKKHSEFLGMAASVLRRGDPNHTTDYAVWSQGGTLVRVANDKNALRAAWVDLGRL